MLGKYYYGEIVRCVKSGYNVTIREDDDENIVFTYPILRNVRNAILKKENGNYIDIKYNRTYEKIIYSFAEKGKYYIMNVKPIKKAMKNLSFKDKLLLVKAIISIESTNKLDRINNKEKKKTNSNLK